MSKPNKELYRKIYSDYDIPLHMSPEWMDAVCVKGAWDVIISNDNSGNLEGVLVYHYRKVLGMVFILMPPMCFYSGIYLFYRDMKNGHQKISFENKVSLKLIRMLPSFSFYYQQYHPSYTNWSSLFWEGFSQSTRYSYRLNTNTSKENLWSKLKPNLKRNINKAENICTIKTCSFDQFWVALKDSYQKRKNPFDQGLLLKLYTSLSSTSSCQLSVCIDSNNKILAGSFIAFDKNTSYYLCGFYNPKGKELGGLSYLLWHHLINNPRPVFDFEGSMIKEIEYFFRSFGADWTPHFRIWKISSPLLSGLIRWKFKNILNA